MAGLVPAIHVFVLPPYRYAILIPMAGWLYIMTNRYAEKQDNILGKTAGNEHQALATRVESAPDPPR